MFERLSKFVDRHWRLILAVWVLAFLGATAVHAGWFNRLHLFPFKVPTWRDVAEDGEFAFLPPDVQSLAGERLLAQAFPDDLLKSSVVIVVRRYKNPLLPVDEEFIEEVLKPRLVAIQHEVIEDEADRLEVRTLKDKWAGSLLKSQDQEATLVILPLKTEFLEWGNRPIIDRIEKLLDDDLPKEIPPGLDLKMSGSATVGRDMLVANDESGRKTELATVVLVIFLLVVIYRSLVLAAIPLATVVVSVHIAKALVVLLTQVPGIHYRVFFGMEVYITIVVYGAGVDYCLFLIARYKEEIDKGLSLRQALMATLTSVGAALTASALTVICGIGMMVFAQFGKFREAGIGISLGLTVGLLAALTLAPAMLRLAGSIALFPFGRLEKFHARPGWVAGTSLINRLVPQNFFYRRWEDVGNWVVRKPGTILITCVVLMIPFAAWGLINYEYLSYGLLSELPPSKKSVVGAKAVQEHFPAGYAGPLTILIHNDEVDFGGFGGEGRNALGTLISRLEAQRDELGIADIRSLHRPRGLHIPEESGAVRRAVQLKKATDYYVSSVPGLANHVTRLDVVSKNDPFERESIKQLEKVERALRTLLQDPELAVLQNSTMQFVGPTASIRDLKIVTDNDQIKIDLLVLGVVFAILVLLLRKIAISAYLIVSVFFSYFVALGVTFVVFQCINPQGFSGLDWKVPMFLFTILMAIGEDYNIFLMTRIEEEQRLHGPIEGVRVAMLKTGTIISSCGIIMAGTFTSLLFGTLVGLKQLGFALAFGVLLDTFVVRPLLVPAYLILLYQGRFGVLNKWLGGTHHSKASSGSQRGGNRDSDGSSPPPFDSPDEPKPKPPKPKGKPTSFSQERAAS